MEMTAPAQFSLKYPDQMFYVGFMRSAEAWFPLCMVSNPLQKKRLDTLLLSQSYNEISEAVQRYAGKIPQVEETFVLYVTHAEIEKLVESYGLESIAVVLPEEGEAGCDCGCGCR